jgi:hypothetical protein
MKFTFRNRVVALEKRLAIGGAKIRIEGGLPEGFRAPEAQPPGADLKHQARAFGKPKPVETAPVQPWANPAKRA